MTDQTEVTIHMFNDGHDGVEGCKPKYKDGFISFIIVWARGSKQSGPFRIQIPGGLTAGSHDFDLVIRDLETYPFAPEAEGRTNIHDNEIGLRLWRGSEDNPEETHNDPNAPTYWGDGLQSHPIE